MIFGNFWTTWFYDLVPDKIMGRHTAWRNTILSSLQLTLALATGIFARRYTTDTVPWGFFITILSIAALSRYVSSRMLVMQFEPPRSRPFQPLPLLKFSLPKPLIVYGTGMALFHGAAAMAGPFFSVWYLRDLKFDYLTFTIGSACATIGTVSSLRLWGRLVDGYGPARMLRIAAMLAACAPFPYLVSTTPAAIWAFNFFAGVAWTGINIGGFKYLLRATGTECQEQALSFVNCAQGASMFLFGLLGAYFAANLPAILGYRLRGLFLLSGLLRFAICSFVLVRLRDRGEAPAPGDLLARAGRLLGWRNHSSVGLDSRAREQ
jgi:MFS family permease